MHTLGLNLFIIPARKGSKSIKKKNIKLFNKKPLIYWTIKLAKESNLGQVCVTTDCKIIQKYALSLGVDAPFIRPKSLSKDNTPIEPVIKHAINFYKNKKKIFFDSFFLLQPTSPFRTKTDIIDAIKLYKKKNYSSIFSVSEATANNNPHWMLKKNIKNKPVKFTDGGKLENLITRRQLLPKVYYRNDFVYLSSVKNIFAKTSNLYGNNPGLLIPDKDRIEIDINTPKEWYVAEKMHKTLKLDK